MSLFTFTLRATDQVSGATGSAKLVVATNMPPCCGTLVVNPPKGTFGTIFTLTAVGFWDDDLPLAYIFSQHSPDGDGHLAGPQSFPQHAENMLLTGSSSLLVRAVDSLGGEGSASASVRVNPLRTESKTEAANIVVDRLASSVFAAGEAKDSSAVVLAVAALASALLPPPPSAPPSGMVGGERACANFYCQDGGRGGSSQPSAEAVTEADARESLLTALESVAPSEEDTIEANLGVTQAVVQMSRTFLTSQTDPAAQVSSK